MVMKILMKVKRLILFLLVRVVDGPCAEGKKNSETIL